jgi:hypothetical protein
VTGDQLRRGGIRRGRPLCRPGQQCQ